MSQEEVVNYDWYMKKGNADLNIGRFANAAIAFMSAAGTERNAYEKACAYQMMGVALRLNKDFPEAGIAFGYAMKYVNGNDKLWLRIERDIGALLMEQGKLKEAAERLGKSYKGLLKLKSYTEAATSLGYLGRVEFLKGDKRKAYLLLAEADAILRSVGVNGTYELNNLIWLFKRVSLFERIALLPRILRLIRQTGQRRRMVEVVLLVVGGNWLYDYAKHRRWSGS